MNMMIQDALDAVGTAVAVTVGGTLNVLGAIDPQI
jgi:hypothetical protein